MAQHFWYEHFMRKSSIQAELLGLWDRVPWGLRIALQKSALYEMVLTCIEMGLGLAFDV